MTLAFNRLYQAGPQPQIVVNQHTSLGLNHTNQVKYRDVIGKMVHIYKSISGIYSAKRTTGI